MTLSTTPTNAPTGDSPRAPVDDTRPVRDGEQLDLERIDAFLVRALPDLPRPLSLRQFPGGHSNLTYLLQAGAGDEARELVLRRPPFGSKVKSAHDMGREYRILSRLAPAYPLAPRPLAWCEDPAVMGCSFYLMERLRGVILRRALPSGATLPPEVARGLSEHAVDELARLHSIDYAAAGLGDLGKPEGYVRRQVEGWTRRYRDSKTDEIAAVDEAATWLAARMPPDNRAESGAALIHNDWKYDNLVLDPHDWTRIVGVLDWEMATLGDPLMDLGTALGYWSEASDSDELRTVLFGLTWLPGSLTRRQLADRYAAATGRDLSNILFYYVFALFKTAVVLQQIYYRYQQGLTRDERFAMFIHGVRILAETAVAAAARGSL